MDKSIPHLHKRRKGKTLADLIIFVLLFLPLTLHSATVDGMFYLKKIETRYAKVENFRAKFTQTSRAPGVVQNEQAKGIVYLRKDGKFRWDYEKPEVVLIVSDGQTLWIYQAEDKQVMVDPRFGKKMKRFPYTFLSGMQNLHRDFTATIKKVGDRSVVLELIPRKQLKDIRKMSLTLDKKTLFILKISWVTFQEVETSIGFDDIDITSKIPDSVFHFDPPEGVDIVRMDAQ